MIPTTIPTLWRYLSMRAIRIPRISESDGGRNGAGAWPLAAVLIKKSAQKVIGSFHSFQCSYGFLHAGLQRVLGRA
jgi:hypothetical protein